MNEYMNLIKLYKEDFMEFINFAKDILEMVNAAEAFFNPIDKNLTKQMNFENNSNMKIQLYSLYFKFLIPTEEGYKVKGVKQYQVKEGVQMNLEHG